MNVAGKFRKWLLQEPEEPRRAPRLNEPEVIVYYWDGSVPEGRRIRDISASGAYIFTPERWYPGTIVRIILQGYPTAVQSGGVASSAPSICIESRVLRDGTDGVAVEFIFQDKKEEEAFKTFLGGIPAQPPKEWAADPRAVEAKSGKRGQGLIEFALIIPLVLLLAVNAVNFGGFLFAWITVANAARDGAQYMAMSSASPGQPSPATQAQITALVTADVTSLMNRSSIQVAVCSNPATAQAPTVCALSDPETGYTLGAVDVTYTYQPFIPLFSFPKLGISATLPSSTIHRKAVMRMIQ